MKNHTVAFQGEHGAFSEEAALRYFPKPVSAVPVRTFEEVFKMVDRGLVHHGIIPIENSLFGSIHQNYDLLLKYHLNITGEIKLRVVPALLVNRGVSPPQIRYVYSHPQALGQCERFLGRLRRVEAVAGYDTAGAAKSIKEEGRRDAAAIASVGAARVYDLKVLKKGIESDHRNFTRFLILSKMKTGVPVGVRRCKRSIIFSMKNIPGALYKALSVFAMRDINLHKIESRPLVGSPWEYLFYLDFQGSESDEACRNAINHLKEITSYLKILGSYDEGKTVGR